MFGDGGIDLSQLGRSKGHHPVLRATMSAPTHAAAPPIGPVGRCMAAFPYSRRGALDVYAPLSSGIGLAGYGISWAPTGWPSLIRAGRQGRGSWCRPASPMWSYDGLCRKGSPAPVASALAACCSPLVLPPFHQNSRCRAPRRRWQSVVAKTVRCCGRTPVLALRRAPHHAPIYTRRAATFRAGPNRNEAGAVHTREASLARDPSRVAAFIGWRVCRTGRTGWLAGPYVVD